MESFFETSCSAVAGTDKPEYDEGGAIFMDQNESEVIYRVRVGLQMERRRNQERLKKFRRRRSRRRSPSPDMETQPSRAPNSSSSQLIRIEEEVVSLRMSLEEKNCECEILRRQVAMWKAKAKDMGDSYSKQTAETSPSTVSENDDISCTSMETAELDDKLDDAIDDEEVIRETSCADEQIEPDEMPAEEESSKQTTTASLPLPWVIFNLSVGVGMSTSFGQASTSNEINICFKRGWPATLQADILICCRTTLYDPTFTSNLWKQPASSAFDYNVDPMDTPHVRPTFRLRSLSLFDAFLRYVL